MSRWVRYRGCVSLVHLANPTSDSRRIRPLVWECMCLCLKEATPPEIRERRTRCGAVRWPTAGTLVRGGSWATTFARRQWNAVVSPTMAHDAFGWSRRTGFEAAYNVQPVRHSQSSYHCKLSALRNLAGDIAQSSRPPAGFLHCLSLHFAKHSNSFNCTTLLVRVIQK